MKNNVFALLCISGTLTVVTFFIAFQNNEPWIAPPEADALKNPLDGNKTTAKSENLYSSHCERCHGNYGKGDGIDGKKSNPKPTDLTAEKVQKQSDGALYWKISNGRGAMNAFKDILNEKDRWLLVNYIRELDKSENPVSYFKPAK